MSDHFERVDRLDAHAMALVDELETFLAGRPVDVVVDALATAAARVVAREANLSGSEIMGEIRGATAFVEEALQTVVEPTRRDRLRFTFYALKVTALSSPVINAMEGCGE